MGHDNLTIGKLRGLTRASTPRGIFTVLAFDHRQSFVKMLSSQGDIPYAKVSVIKASVVKTLAPHASAVLLDPVYGAAQVIAERALPGSTGLMVTLEETGYAGSDIGRVTTLLPGWSVEKIKRMGADAVKLLVYYHPDAGETTDRQDELVTLIVNECQKYDLPLFLEAVSYSIDPSVDKNSAQFAAGRPRLVTEIARRLGALKPEILKLEFPVDAYYNQEEQSWARACDMLSAASPCPWTVLSAGVAYSVFVRQVEAACRNGASGFIAGRAVWQEGVSMAEAERMVWFDKVATRRLEELSEIADRYARSWMDFFPVPRVVDYEDWYQTYE
jgi:tagatose 1,6-diphosphate aldolase